MSRPWFRFYGADYLTDLKTRNFTAAQHSCWLHLLCFACNSKTPGVIYDLTEETLMMYAGIRRNSQQWNNTKGVFKMLSDMRMIRIDDARVTLLNWNARQYESDSSMLRTRKYRATERQKKYKEKVKRHGDVTVTPPETETEADTEQKQKHTHQNVTQSVTKASLEIFEKFWKPYPRKVGKQAAIRAWLKAKPPPIDKVLDALEKQKQSEQWHKEGGSFIPHPTTWINQGRWDDEEVTSSRRVDKF